MGGSTADTGLLPISLPSSVTLVSSSKEEVAASTDIDGGCTDVNVVVADSSGGGCGGGGDDGFVSFDSVPVAGPEQLLRSLVNSSTP